MNMREQMKADLKAAMKNRERSTIQTLRSLLSAIDNAEAVEMGDMVNPSVGRSNDVPRKILTDNDVQQILQKELDEHRSALAEYERLGQEEAANQLRAEVEVIARYMED